jgi:aspartate/methionine/tyrosine aminotransferase
MEAYFSNEQVNMDALARKAFNYRWAVHARGIIPLTAADPDFPVAPQIKESIQKYIEDGYFSYGPPEGLIAFKNAISSWYKRQHHSDCNPDFILPVNSAAYALFVVMKTILNEGDQAIIPDPVDFLFRKSVEYAKGIVIPSGLDMDTACFNFTELEKQVNLKTKALMLCNPNNPLGKSYSLAQINEVKAFAKKHDLWLIADEIWADIYYDKKVCSVLNSESISYNKTVVISGLSKNFGLAGLRIGYIICPNHAFYAKALENSLHQSTAFGLSPIAQAAGISALTECDEWLHAFRLHLGKMKMLTHEFIKNSGFLMPVESDSTYLSFPKIKQEINSEGLVKKILEYSNVALVPGGINWFESKSEGYLRICYATSEAILREAFERINSKAEQFL